MWRGCAELCRESGCSLDLAALVSCGKCRGSASLGTDLRVCGVTPKGGWSPSRDTRRCGWRPLDVKIVAGNSYLMEICFPWHVSFRDNFTYLAGEQRARWFGAV